MIASCAVSDRACFAVRHTGTVAEVPWLHRTLLGKPVKFTAHRLDQATNRLLRFTTRAVRFTSSAILRPHPRGRARRGVNFRNNYTDPLSCMPSRRALLWLAGAALLSSASAHGIARQVQAFRENVGFDLPAPSVNSASTVSCRACLQQQRSLSPLNLVMRQPHRRREICQHAALSI